MKKYAQKKHGKTFHNYCFCRLSNEDSVPSHTEVQSGVTVASTIISNDIFGILYRRTFSSARTTYIQMDDTLISVLGFFAAGKKQSRT